LMLYTDIQWKISGLRADSSSYGGILLKGLQLFTGGKN